MDNVESSLVAAREGLSHAGGAESGAPPLGRDTLGLVLAALFPSMEDVFAALAAFAAERTPAARAATHDHALRVALRAHFSPAPEAPLDPLLCRAWLWCQRAHKETLSPAEAVCGFALSPAEAAALTGGGGAALSVTAVVRVALGRSLGGCLPALARALRPRVRVLQQARAAVAHAGGDYARLAAFAHVRRRVEEAVRRETPDAAVIDAARTVLELLRAMEEAARPFSLEQLRIDPAALLNKRNLDSGARTVRSDAVDFVRRRRAEAAEE